MFSEEIPLFRVQPISVYIVFPSSTTICKRYSTDSDDVIDKARIRANTIVLIARGDIECTLKEI